MTLLITAVQLKKYANIGSPIGQLYFRIQAKFFLTLKVLKSFDTGTANTIPRGLPAIVLHIKVFLFMICF